MSKNDATLSKTHPDLLQSTGFGVNALCSRAFGKRGISGMGSNPTTCVLSRPGLCHRPTP